jgi:Holliday junction resolvasome RuvABC ATP-dependent DNA helicase subunit
MSQHKHQFDHKEIVKQICDFMGEDLDAPACQEVADHLKTCPTCQVQLDTIKRTVTMCREMEDKKKIPKEVNDRLFKVLNLDEIKKTNR